MKLVQIALLTCAVVSANAFAQNLLLSCTVKGTNDTGALGPETITVTVNNLKDFLHIDIDGPMDFQGGYSTGSPENSVLKTEGVNLSDANNFTISSKRTMKASGNIAETIVRINRSTGMFYLIERSTVGGLTLFKDINGPCTKITAKNRF